MTVIAMSRTEIDEHAQTELVGKAMILTDGKAGTVENVWLDEMHGLRVSIRGHDGKWHVSTIKFAQRAEMVQQRNDRLAGSSTSQQVSCSSFGTRF
jgi:predicted ATPase